MTEAPIGWHDSSTLKTVLYDATAARLTIAFFSGSSVDYENLPPEIYDALDRGPSAGAQYHLFVKGWNEQSPEQRAERVQKALAYVAGLKPSVGYRESDEPPPIGHNNPPEPVEAAPSAPSAVPEPTSFEARQARIATLTATANRWIVEREKITDADMAQKCSGFREQIKTEIKDADAARLATTAPLRLRVDEINFAFATLVAPMKKTEEMLGPRMKVWLQAENARLAEEKRVADAEAKRLADEAEKLRQATAQSLTPVEASLAADQALVAAADAEVVARRAPDRAQVKHAGSARASSLRKVYFAVVEDPLELIGYCLSVPKYEAQILELVQSLANAEARCGAGRDGKPNVPGCRLEFKEEA